MLADDYAGLDEFGGKKKGGPKARSLKPLTSDDGASPMEQLRSILSSNFGRVIELFRAWDDDGNQQVSKKEFRQALPVLGLLVERADADELFEEFDVDGSGEIDYTELAKQLRVGSGVELDAALQAGAMGEIEVERDQKFALRSGLDENVGKMGNLSMDADSDVPIIEQLSRALGAPGVLARVIDIFRAWDDDDSGTVSKKEFSKALPMLGLQVSKLQASELFDTFDEDRCAHDTAGICRRICRRISGLLRPSPAFSGLLRPRLTLPLCHTVLTSAGRARSITARYTRSSGRLRQR